MPGADYAWAPRLPATLQSAGLADVEAIGRADVLRGGTPAAEFLAVTLEAVRDRISPAVDVDAGVAWLRDARTVEPGFVWYTAWGYRPS
jgi:hypothetical protein